MDYVDWKDNWENLIDKCDKLEKELELKLEPIVRKIITLKD